MTTPDIQELLEQSEKTDINVLLTAKEGAKRAVLDSPSSANLASLERATRMLNAYLGQDSVPSQDGAGDGGAVPYEQTKKKIEVFNYLIAAGWKVSQSTFYKHVKEGKLTPNKTGFFTERKVRKYANDNLPKVETGKKLSEETDGLARQKQRAEIEKLELYVKRERFKHGIEQGKYILREEIEIEQAGKAAILDAGLKNKARSRAPEMVAAVGGKQDKTGELINFLIDLIDEGLHEYSNPRDFEVLFPAAANIK